MYVLGFDRAETSTACTKGLVRSWCGCFSALSPSAFCTFAFFGVLVGEAGSPAAGAFLLLFWGAEGWKLGASRWLAMCISGWLVRDSLDFFPPGNEPDRDIASCNNSSADTAPVLAAPGCVLSSKVEVGGLLNRVCGSSSSLDIP